MDQFWPRSSKAEGILTRPLKRNRKKLVATLKKSGASDEMWKGERIVEDSGRSPFRGRRGRDKRVSCEKGP